MTATDVATMATTKAQHAPTPTTTTVQYKIRLYCTVSVFQCGWDRYQDKRMNAIIITTTVVTMICIVIHYYGIVSYFAFYSLQLIKLFYYIVLHNTSNTHLCICYSFNLFQLCIYLFFFTLSLLLAMHNHVGFCRTNISLACRAT